MGIIHESAQMRTSSLLNPGPCLHRSTACCLLNAPAISGSSCPYGPESFKKAETFGNALSLLRAARRLHTALNLMDCSRGVSIYPFNVYWIGADQDLQGSVKLMAQSGPIAAVKAPPLGRSKVQVRQQGYNGR